MMDYAYLLKYIIVGDMGVGKSCVMLSFVEGNFRENHDITIGVEFGTRRIEHDQKTVKLQIWDTAGQENFRSLTRSYYRAAVAALLVYDITRRDSFNSLERWLEEVKANANDHLSILLIGNKADRESDRQVSTFEGEKFAQENGLFFIETSAKTGTNVEKAFGTLTDQVFQKINSGEIDVTNENSGVKVGSGILNSGKKLGQQTNNQQTGGKTCC